MALLFSSKISSRLLTILAERGPLAVGELQAHLRIRKCTVTRQAVHKVMRALISQGAIYKTGHCYGVSHVWLSEFVSLGEHWMHSALAHAVRLLPSDGESARYVFHHPLRMKLFWSHLVLAAIQSGRSGMLLSWNPHPWFYLALADHEAQMLHSLERHSVTMLKAIGGAFKLDRVTELVWRKAKRSRFRFSVQHPELRSTEYLSVVPPYVIRVVIARRLSKEIEKIYSTADDAFCGAQEIMRVLSDSHRCVVYISNSSRRARRYEEIYKEIFGSIATCKNI